MMITARARPPQLPLSFAQEGMWFLQQLNELGSTYNMTLAWRLSGRLDRLALERSFAELVRRHESLRIRFTTLDGQVIQVIDAPGEFGLTALDLSSLAEQAREDEAARFTRREAEHVFDLERGPLFKVALLRLAADEHLVQVTMHHIISDGWSLRRVLLPELGALYAAFLQGQPSPLPALEVQYADVALWQREWLQGKALDRQLAYWRRQLQDAPAALELPTDRLRPAVRSFKGAKVSFAISSKASNALIDLTRRRKATLYTVLLTVFQLLLSRWSGQQDVVVGSPIAGRTQRQTEGIIGLFVNTLVLRTDLSGNPSVNELLERVKKTCLGAFAHQDIPFEKLVAELQPQRDLSRQALFQVMFHLHNIPRDRQELPDLRLTQVEQSQVTAKFDLSLHMWETQQGLQSYFEYSTDLFDRPTIERLCGYFVRLSESIAEVSGDAPISELEMLSAAERRRRIDGHNGVAPANPFVVFARAEVEQTLTARFEAQVSRCPAALAVEDGIVSWSYKELDQQADGIASALLSRSSGGVGVVALLFEHGAPMIAAMLGVLKAGGTYIPLDPLYPQERLRFILRDARATAIVCDASNVAQATSCAGGALPVVEAGGIAGQDVVQRGTRSPNTATYILYTSGSTGRPKGVLQSDRNVLHFIASYTNALHLHAGDRLSLFAPYGFDASVMDIYAALLNGASLHVRNISRGRFQGLSGWLSERGITVWHSTPTVFRLTVGEFEDRAPSSVRLVVLGGEEAVPSDVTLLREHFANGCLLVNGYGPTESTVSAQHFCDGRSTPGGRHLPIGYPVESTRIVLLDGSGKPADLIGEIGISSAHVALGYVNQAELTAERFVPSPFADGERLYRTGDVARWRTDGALEYLGRLDQQVKIGGLRIELGEIEVALLEQQGIEQAVVVAREDTPGDRRLVGYVVGAAAAVGELRSALRRRLPEYMVPTSIVLLERLPVTQNGKVDRRALPAPAGARDSVSVDYVAPRTPTELLLVSVWAEVLKVDRVGIHDNFFELGGHSLLAVRLAHRLHDVLGSKVPVVSIFRAPTVELFVSELERHHDSTSRIAPMLIRGGTEQLGPLHLVHDFTGLVNCYQKLSPFLDPRYDILAFEANFLPSRPASTVESIARRYLQTIDQTDRSRPLMLAGYSFGALVAFEMARILRLMDFVVAPPILIAPPLNVLRRARKFSGSAICTEADAQAALGKVFRAGEDNIPGVVKFMAAEHIAAARRYAPSFLDIECVLILPEDEDKTGGDWAILCRRLNCLTVPGDHYSIFEPHRLPSLAAALNESIQDFKSIEQPTRRSWISV